jgi:hypothetical protein
MAHLKNRRPDFFTDWGKGGTFSRFEKLSKADWADAFCDLYQQVFGEGTSAEEMMADAERRTRILKGYRAVPESTADVERREAFEAAQKVKEAWSVLGRDR